MSNWESQYKALLEAKEQLVQEPLSYSREDLDPVLSKQNLDFHYGKLARAYVDRYNKGEGDPDFNKAGAFLHNIFFAQFQPPRRSNKPSDNALAFIEKHFKSYEDFQDEVSKVAMGIQGSGWVYLAKNGTIKTIKNHQIKNDIVLLIDWWEHAWYTDYGPDKAGYLKKIWQIVDWSKITAKLA